MNFSNDFLYNCEFTSRIERERERELGRLYFKTACIGRCIRRARMLLAHDAGAGRESVVAATPSSATYPCIMHLMLVT